MNTNSDFSFYKADITDAQFIHSVRNDDLTRYVLHNGTKFNLTDTQKWLASLPSTSERWVCCYQSIPVGVARIDQINNIYNTCSAGLDIHVDHRGKHYAVPIWTMMLDELFLVRNMYLVWLEVLQFNSKALNIYYKLGFRQEGVLRDRVVRYGRRINSIIMSIKQNEWLKRD